MHSVISNRDINLSARRLLLLSVVSPSLEYGKVCRLPDNRYPKQLLSQEWEIKPHKGRQRKTWSRTIDDIFHSLSLDKGEILDDMHEETLYMPKCNLALFRKRALFAQFVSGYCVQTIHNFIWVPPTKDLPEPKCYIQHELAHGHAC